MALELLLETSKDSAMRRFVSCLVVAWLACVPAAAQTTADSPVNDCRVAAINELARCVQIGDRIRVTFLGPKGPTSIQGRLLGIKGDQMTVKAERGRLVDFSDADVKTVAWVPKSTWKARMIGLALGVAAAAWVGQSLDAHLGCDGSCNTYLTLMGALFGEVACVALADDLAERTVLSRASPITSGRAGLAWTFRF